MIAGDDFVVVLRIEYPSLREQQLIIFDSMNRDNCRSDMLYHSYERKL